MASPTMVWTIAPNQLIEVLAANTEIDDQADGPSTIATPADDAERDVDDVGDDPVRPVAVDHRDRPGCRRRRAAAGATGLRRRGAAAGASAAGAGGAASGGGVCVVSSMWTGASLASFHGSVASRRPRVGPILATDSRLTSLFRRLGPFSAPILRPATPSGARRSSGRPASAGSAAAVRRAGSRPWRRRRSRGCCRPPDRSSADGGRDRR